MHPDDDKALVTAFRQTGNEQSFRILYRACTPTVYKLILQLTGKDDSIAADLMQESWIRAIERLPAFEFRSSFKTWLTGIAINCCREYNRKYKPQQLPENGTETGISNKIPADSRMDVINALAALPEGYREVLLLHDMEGYKHHEIGSMLGISEGTSKSQLFHARKAMKKLIA